MTNYIFVTGGVVSSLGKGIAAASLAAILEARGLKVTMLKLDPYINVDPGTMSPIQHGEVFVTDDGAETDLDLGHYERFIRTRMTKRPHQMIEKNLRLTFFITCNMLLTPANEVFQLGLNVHSLCSQYRFNRFTLYHNSCNLTLYI
jgi:hypothetical protein